MRSEIKLISIFLFDGDLFFTNWIVIVELLFGSELKKSSHIIELILLQDHFKGILDNKQKYPLEKTVVY